MIASITYFTMLPVKDLVNYFQVCKQFNGIVKANTIWFPLFKKKFYKFTNTNTKNFYKNSKKYSVLNNWLLKMSKANLDHFTDGQGIGQLISLEILSVSHNKLQFIPPEIGNLTNLQILHLYHNKLQSVPQEIVKLSMLKELKLKK
jgi:Leucine-rich repeat (LRR) protein